MPMSESASVGIDLEADNLHRYAEQLCLIQISDGKDVFLVDPLEVDDLSSLERFLAAESIWMHGADFDMTLLRREFGTLPKMIFDTQIAARLLGILRFSYANLVDQFFDVKLCKASQKENWGQRPLPEKMREYASNDVRYLLPLANAQAPLPHNNLIQTHLWWVALHPRCLMMYLGIQLQHSLLMKMAIPA